MQHLAVTQWITTYSKCCCQTLNQNQEDYYHIIPVLPTLRCLPVSVTRDFKVLLLVFEALNGSGIDFRLQTVVLQSLMSYIIFTIVYCIGVFLLWHLIFCKYSLLLLSVSVTESRTPGFAHQVKHILISG